MITFKLTQEDDGVMRKANFDRPPKWDALAAKVELLFKLPATEVGLSYADPDGDEVTISTDEELSDYYAQNKGLRVVKLVVTRLAPRAPSVAQVPDHFDLDDEEDSPEPVMIEEQDWTAPRREGMLGSMPLFDTLPPNVLNSLSFGFGRSASPAQSEARIEEVPSELPSRANSVSVEESINKSSATATPIFMRGKGKKEKDQKEKEREQLQQQQHQRELEQERAIEEERERERQRAADKERERAYNERKSRGRNIVDLAALGAPTATPRAAAQQFRAGVSVNTAARGADSVSSEAGSDNEEDPELPSVQPTVAAPSNAPPRSIYDDIAGVMNALNNILIRASDGTYLQPQVDSAISMANSAAKAAIEESARRAQDSISNVLRTLGSPAAPPRGPTAVGLTGLHGVGTTPTVTSYGLPRDRPRSRPRGSASASQRDNSWSMFPEQNDAVPTLKAPTFGPTPTVKQMPPFASNPWPETHIPAFIPPMPAPEGGMFCQIGATSVTAVPPRLDTKAPGSQMRGMFSSTPGPTSPQLPRPQNSAFTGSRFNPAVGPQAQARVPEAFIPPVEPEVMLGLEVGDQLAAKAEKERLEAARKMYKQEKANFRAQKEAERLERAERKARREKGFSTGPEMSTLADTLESALKTQIQPADGDPIRPIPVRPREMPELFVPPISGTHEPPPPVEDDPWNHGVLPVPQPWKKPMAGPHTDQNKRLIQRLDDMGFSVSTHPQIPTIVKQQTKNNLTRSDDELIERILEVVIAADTRPATAGPSGGKRR